MIQLCRQSGLQRLADEAGQQPTDEFELELKDGRWMLMCVQPTTEGGPRLTGLPLSFDGERPPLRRTAPELGADTDAIFEN